MNLLQFLLYSLILSFCFGQFGKIPIGGGEVGIYLWDILTVLLVFYWLALKLGVKKRLDLPPLWASIFLFSFISLIALINGKRWIGAGEWVVAAAYWARWVVYAGVYFVVSDLSKKISNFQFLISNLLVLSGVILALAGFVQLFIFPNLSNLDPSLGWDPHQGRMVSTWLDPNFLGAYFVLCLALLTNRFFSYCFESGSELGRQSSNVKIPWLLGSLPAEEVGSPKRRQMSNQIQNLNVKKGLNLGFRILLLATYYLILTSGLLLTFSRSAWAMLAIVVGVFGVFKSRKLLVLMVVIFFGAYFFVPRVQTRLSGITDPADSASLRLVSWRQTFEIIKKHPLMGVGFNAFRYAQEREGFFRDSRGVSMTSGHAGAGSDSSLLLVWATTGIFGLLSYLWLYGNIAWRALSKVGRRPTEEKSLPISQRPNSPESDSLRRKESDSFPSGASASRLALLAALAGLFIESNFINSLFYPPILLWLWIVTGLAINTI